MISWLLALVAATSPATPWQLGPFARPGGTVNPVVSPDPAAVFDGPLRHAPVHWAAGHTFNPAAVLHDGKVFLLFRAEDQSGPNAIGGHTSRLGLATSADGLHFDRRPAPSSTPTTTPRRPTSGPAAARTPA